MLSRFFENNKVVHVAPDDGAATTYALAGGTTDVNSVAVDALGFEEITFLLVFGNNLDTGTFAGTIEGSANGTTGWTAITDAVDSFTAGASDTDDEMLGISCKVDPAYRYYRVASNRGVANTVGACYLAVLSGAAQAPVTQPTSAGQFINSPTIA